MADDFGCGSISLILGCMWSGKTTELLRQIDRYIFAGKRVLLIKPSFDERYSKSDIVTHPDSQSNQTSLVARTVKTLSEIDILELKFAYDIIGVDEGNFFGDELSECCDKWANIGKIVIIAALNSNFKRENFGYIIDLIPKAEHIVKLSAICFRCKKKAHFTHRKNDNNEEKVLGGKDIYEALCRKCFIFADSSK